MKVNRVFGRRSWQTSTLFTLMFLMVGMVMSLQVTWAQPAISSLSASTLPRSGRLLIQGSGFGAVQDTAHVEIGGLTALVTRWSDTLIAAYVPEATPAGAATVQVFAGGVASNAQPLTVTLRQPNGRVKWRFQADAPYFFHRAALGPDGTIIAHDAGGFVYALTPDGGLKWIYKTRVFATGPPSVGADGSVYVGDSTTVSALSSAGKLKWTFTDPNARSLAAGPTVGPDGKIYAFFNPIAGVFAFTPDGAVAWKYSSPNLFDLFEWGVEMAFGSTGAGMPASQVYLSFGVAPTGFLWAFDMASGALAFSDPMASTWDSTMQPQGQTVTAPDGTIYTAANVAIGSSSSVNAFNPDGSLKWRYERFGGISAPDIGPNGNVYFAYQAGHLGAVSAQGAPLWDVFDGVSMLQYPIANPAGGMVFVGGGVFGSPGFVRAYNTADGGLLWQIDLPFENGGNQWIGSRPRFTPDGQTVYFGTTIPGGAADSYCYLYAVGTATSPTLMNVAIANGVIGQSVPLRALLRRKPDGQRVSGKTLTFQLDGVTLGTALTDANGLATYNYALSNNAITGSRSVSVSFAGDADYIPSAGTSTLTIRYATLLTAANASGRTGQSVPLRALLRRKPDGLRLSSKTLTFKLDGTSLGTAVTDANGLAAFHYAIPNNAISGSKTITVSFDGDTDNFYSFRSATLIIN